MKSLVVVFAAVALSACGMSSSEFSEYQQSVAELQVQVSAYETDSATTTTRDECLARSQAYETAARPHLQRMMGLGDSMDVCGRMMGRRPSVQFSSMCSSMKTELDRYAANPCGVDVTANHEQASTHCQRMRAWIDQQVGGMGSMSGGGCGR